MMTRVEGSIAPFLEVDLAPGERLLTEVGTLMSREPGVDISTRVSGGLAGGLRRLVTGASFFLAELTGPGQVRLSRGASGRVVPLDVTAGRPMRLQSRSFLCADAAVGLRVAAAPGWLDALLWSGHLPAFLLELAGEGQAWAFAWGDTVEIHLGAGERLDVAPGRIVALEGSVGFEAVAVGGVKDMLFSGVGPTLAALTGPGRVVLQSRDLEQARPERLVVKERVTERERRPEPPRKPRPPKAPRPPRPRPRPGPPADESPSDWLWRGHRGDGPGGE